MISATGTGLSAARRLNIVRRSAPLILACTVVLAALAYGLSTQQRDLYQASTEVFVDTQNVGSSIADIQQTVKDPDRVLTTQAAVAETPAVATKALELAGLSDPTPGQLLDRIDVRTNPNADILLFAVTDEEPQLARRLSIAYARGYAAYRRELDTKTLERARAEVDAQIRRLRRDGERRSPVYADLVDSSQQLRTRALLQSTNAAVGREAEEAVQVQPHPVRNAILGGALGLLLGLGLALLLDALNTRVRSAEEAEERLDLPLLARVPEPPKRLRAINEVAMLVEPASRASEGYRMLSTNIEFANLDMGASSIMVTSSTVAEGKSTTIANLAVAAARTGRTVALVDLDLRRPYLHRLFGLAERPGVTDVTLGRTPLEEALHDIALEREDHPAFENGGRLEVLCSGPLPPNPAEFVRSAALGKVIGDLKERADLVLIDAPPMLTVTDAMVISSHADAVIIAARLPDVRRHMLDDLRRMLETAPIAKLGFFITGTDADDAGYGYGYGYPSRPEHETLKAS